MFKWIRFGKLLYEGIELYKKKDYIKSKKLFGQALLINQHDFTANFWLARTHVMLNDYAAADQLLAKCKVLKPQVADYLITPWEKIVSRLMGGSDVDLDQLDSQNIETNTQLCTYYFKRLFPLRQLCLLYLALIILVFVSSALYDAWGVWTVPVTSIIFTALILTYFHHSTDLPLNLWLRLKGVTAEMGRLFALPSFWAVVLGYEFFFVIYDLGITALHLTRPDTKLWLLESLQKELAAHSFTAIFLSGIIIAVPEELVFRLCWYNYLAQYNKRLAYFLVAILFWLPHFNPSILLFISSIVYTWGYGQYHTIMAPIFMHIIHNVSRSLLFLMQIQMLQ